MPRTRAALPSITAITVPARPHLPPWFHAMLAAVALVTMAPPAAEAHVFQTNMYPDFELQDGQLIITLWVATFLFPPLEHIKFGDGAPRPDASSEAIRAKLETFFASTCPMAFDDVESAPRLDSLRFEEMEKVSHLGEDRDFTMAKMMFKYDVRGEPRRIKIIWGLWFPDGEVTVEQPEAGELVSHDPNVLDILIFGAGEEYPIYLTKSEPEVVWHAASREFGDAVLAIEPEPASAETVRLPLAPALIAAGLCVFLFAARRFDTRRFGVPAPARLGAVAVAALGIYFARSALPVEMAKFWQRPGPPALDLAAAEDQFLRLHRSIYRAFEADSEDAVYNILAQSVDGSLLDRLYEEVYQSLILRDEGGAISRVGNVEYLDTKVSADPNGPGFEIACTWRVDGVVRHWGHAHRRSNEYQADYTLAPRGKRWKIASSTVNLQKRVNPPSPIGQQGNTD